jgi:imidazolonepropionase
VAKEEVDLLITKAAELLTLQGSSLRPLRKEETGNLNIINDGAVAVHEGKIRAVGKTGGIASRFGSETVIDASGKVVMPGFVDPHTHLVFAGSREEELEQRLKGVSYMEILAKGGGILNTVRATRKAPREQLIETARQRLDVMLRHGTTTVEAKSGYGLTVSDELKCLEAARELDRRHVIDVIPTFLGAHAVPPEFKTKPEEYVDLVVENMIPQVAEHRLAEFCDVFCEAGVFTVDQSRRVLQEGKKQGLRPKVHADELSSFGGAELAAELRAVSAEHLLFASDDGLKAMAQREIVAVLLPAASFSLMNGTYADARRMVQLGVPIALGTDFNPSCWTENIQVAIVLACREMCLTPAEAIVAATINAAHAISRAHEVGSLEEGKNANLTVLNVRSHKFLGYRFGVNLVDKVVKEGNLVVDSEEDSR